MSGYRMTLTLIFMVLIALALILMGCQPRPIPPPPGPDSIPACFAGTRPHPYGVCPDAFTADGLACVICVGAAACFEKVNVIYCADSCRDNRCAPASYWAK